MKELIGEGTKSHKSFNEVMSKEQAGNTRLLYVHYYNHLFIYTGQKKHYPPGNHYATCSYLYKCPISRS